MKLSLPYELYLALRYLRFHRGRTFLSVITLISMIGVTVGTAALVIALSLMTGFQNDVRERVLRGTAHLTVMSTAGRYFELEPAIRDAIVATPGIEGAAPVLYSPAMLTHEDFGSPGYAQIFGIDPGVHGDVILLGGGTDPFEPLTRPTESGREGIVLGAELAEELGAFEGTLIRALVPSVTLTPGGPLPRSRVFEVVGLFESESFLHDSQRAYVRLPAIQRLLRLDRRVSMIELRADDDRADRLSRTKGAVIDSLGDSWIVYDMIEQNQEILKALNMEKVILFLAIGLIVVVAALNIASTLVLMVADKMKEIGTLTAMGARPAGIARVFIFQGVTIGAVGAVLGLALGAALSLAANHYRWIPLDPEVYYLDYVPFIPTTGDLLFAGLLAFAVSFAATIYPAIKAARMDPIEALRYE